MQPFKLIYPRLCDIYPIVTAVAFTALLFLFICSCSIPLHKIPYREIGTIKSTQALKEFTRLLPDQIKTINTITFQYRKKIISAIGCTKIDRNLKTFTVVGLNPMGIKLFELSGNKYDVVCNASFPEFSSYDNFGNAVAEDIRRIYFNLIPSPLAKIKKKKYALIYRQEEAESILEYVYALPNNLIPSENLVLIEKRYLDKKNRKIWSISYYDYTLQDDKIYPANIILKHNKFNYSLKVCLEEIR